MIIIVLAEADFALQNIFPLFAIRASVRGLCPPYLILITFASWLHTFVVLALQPQAAVAIGRTCLSQARLFSVTCQLQTIRSIALRLLVPT